MTRARKTGPNTNRQIEEANTKENTYTVYKLSWSPKNGEATYSRSFDSEEERASYRARIAYDAKSIHTWENTYFED